MLIDKLPSAIKVKHRSLQHTLVPGVAKYLLSPLSNAAAVLSRVLQREHACRPALIFAVGGHPEVFGCKDASPPMTAGGVGIHGRGSCGHQLECHRGTCTE